MITGVDAICPSSYERYESWKGWDRPFTHNNDDAAYFRKEFRGIRLANAKVLEIGFGEGRFLSWAAARTASLYGTELIPAMKTAAERFGVVVLPEKLSEAVRSHEESFDLIVALDVAEHWTLGELTRNIVLVERLLKRGGRLVLRFPNGQSPFGLAPQTADPTHRTALSLAIFERLLIGRSLTPIRYGPQARVLGRNPVKAVIRGTRYLARMMVSATLNFIYATEIPWDAVVTLVLERRQARSGQHSQIQNTEPAARSAP